MKHEERRLQTTEEQARKSHVVNCYQSSYDNPGSYFFCNPDNVPTKEYSKDYLKYGWCCPTGSTQDVCQDTDSHQCTLPDVQQQGVPLFMTYWVGANEPNGFCNSTSTELTATQDVQRQISNNAVIQNREQSIYEACYWIISVEDFKYRDDATLEIAVEDLFQANLYIYEGSSRHNATQFIEGNLTATIGAPYRLSVTSKAIVVLQTKTKAGSGSGSFTYRVVGKSYPFWEKPFLGREVYLWYISLALIVVLPFFFVFLCCCSKRCCYHRKDSDRIHPKVLQEKQLEDTDQSQMSGRIRLNRNNNLKVLPMGKKDDFYMGESS
jgi:hypothetical protein